MGREGALLTRHPLLIQKTMADKLSDKVQVIIAAPGSDGGFIGAGLLGSGQRRSVLADSGDAEEHAAADDARKRRERRAEGECSDALRGSRPKGARRAHRHPR